MNVIALRAVMKDLDEKIVGLMSQRVHVKDKQRWDEVNGEKLSATKNQLSLLTDKMMELLEAQGQFETIVYPDEDAKYTLKSPETKTVVIPLENYIALQGQIGNMEAAIKKVQRELIAADLVDFVAVVEVVRVELGYFRLYLPSLPPENSQ